MLTVSERFWSKVSKTSTCWLWTAGKDSKGYGKFGRFENKIERAHRVSWKLSGKKIPRKKCLLHKCDVRICVRPFHLFLGTRKKNNQDRHRKGRSARGERCHSKILEIQARDILAREYYHGLIRDLSKEFGVSSSTVSHLRSGRKWRHLQ